ncbi:unnamed protein product [Vitrella brassicaformis CCMP3155]|uniref:AAA+ ATPase domain-containing protein n=2 Tax=Vitrella brassicaformis TaxID=1169539 RepID=A0A0G4EVA0_VITBC|nr:unnamed protein product [Vitrella brassicaformis CCMP3155]|mmetsp:Transcript_12448/g.36148  ORF Transcript_12448/g.36148 Transcript_12448/m.36148 type:complete len:602 (-) Transcript_12448:308-2113(-)|eukprot:CEM02546.1 unnamed protein product [Vitrella brassicaformis CCMP3155]
MYFPSLSGGKPPSGGGAPPVAAPAGGMPAGKGDKEGDNITGRFDPTALERGAKALKELDSSPNAGKAFEVTKMQEATKQKELQKQMEELATARAQAVKERTHMEAEEKRKTVDHQHDRERETARYKAQLEAEAYSKKLQDQKKQNEEWLQQQHQQFLRQEELRKKNELELEEARRRRQAEQARLDRETELQKIREEAAARVKQERENADVHLRSLRARFAEERKTKMEQLQIIFGSIGGAFNSLIEDKTRLATVVGGITAAALGIYGARVGTQIAGRYIESRLGKPPLVRETSRWSFNRAWRSYLLGWLWRRPSFQEKIVLPAELSERLEWTSNSLVNAKRNGTPFRHLLLYGPPGTGKTLFARTISRNSGLDYAIMTGGDIGPLGKDAVNEINKLFRWANSSRKGLILFIDEADAFLRRGRMGEGTMSEELRNCLSAFLHHTGTETTNFCVVLATNVREVMDRAVLDRVDEQFEFPLPDLEGRRKMVKMFVDEYIYTPTKRGRKIVVDAALDDEYWDMVAKRTEGFSGRQIAKLAIGMQAAVFGSGTNTLTKGLADTVLNWKLAHFDEDVDTLERRKAQHVKETVVGEDTPHAHAQPAAA